MFCGTQEGCIEWSSNAEVRRSVYVEGLSERGAARRFGLARETVRKMLRYSVPPGYRRAQPVRCPKLDGFTGVIDQILGDDQQRPRKQRHTAKRIWERLRAEHAFTGGYTIVKDYVRAKTLGGQEMFVPLAHPPGDAQADFGEALVVIAGVECKAHYLVVDLPHSDDAFVKAFPAETTEAFCDGHNAAFSYFGGVPRCLVYDNTKLAVARILGDGTRQRTRVFSELQSHYLFDARFGRPGKGNDKGKVEGLVGYARRNFFVPVPRFPSWAALNADLARQCRARRGHRLRRHTETIGERFARDRDALLPLPPVPYEACDTRTTRVTSLSLVRYRCNDYSVPTAYGHRVPHGRVDRVVEHRELAEDLLRLLHAGKRGILVAEDDRVPLGREDQLGGAGDGEQEALELVVAERAGRSGGMRQKRLESAGVGRGKHRQRVSPTAGRVIW